MFPGIFLLKKLIGKSHRPQNKTFIKGIGHVIAYVLWDKNTIDGRRWDIATQEGKFCDVEIEIIFIVVKGSVKLTTQHDQ